MTVQAAALAEVSGDPVLCLDPEGAITHLNPAAERLLGPSTERILGSPLTSVVAEAHRDDVRSVLEMLDDPGLLNPLPMVWVSTKGERTPVTVTGAVVRGADGRREGAWLLARCDEDIFRSGEGDAQPALRGALDSIAVGVAVLEPDGRFVDANDAFRDVLGRPAEELRSMTFLDVTHPEDRPGSEEAVRRLLEGDSASFVMEKRYIEWAGGTMWARTSVFLARDPGGEPLHLVAFIEDITELKEAERALERTERDYADLVNSIDGIVWEADAATIRFSFVSRQAEDILGYPVRAWLEPDFWAEHIHPDDRDWVVPACRRAARERSDHTLEYRMVAADGRTVWMHDLVRVVSDPGGGPVMRGVMVDITDRKRTERALEESEAELRSLMQYAPVGIFRSTPDGRILSANPALARILGYDSVDEVLALDLPDDVYVEGEERQRIAEAVGDEEYHADEATWKRRDGEAIHVRMRTRVVRGPEGDVDVYETFAEDVTERRRLEAQLRQAQKLEAVGRLAGGVAHDFNNVLTAIIGECDLLLEELGEDGDGRREAEAIMKAARHAAELTDQLLAFSRRQVLQPVVMDLNELVLGVRHMLDRLISEDIELETHLEEGLRPVKADPGQLRQVIVNLAINARDAMPNGGRLTLRTENIVLDERAAGGMQVEGAGEYVKLSVSDTGQGMDAETADQVFEPFFTTKEGARGTGLGLATVYGIVKQSGGHVAVESEPGSGTTFTVYLPAVEERPVDEVGEEGGPRSAAAGEGGETVLLIEDEESVRRVTRTTLENLGYGVLEAPDGETALSLAEEHDGPLDLLVSDVILPGIDGIVVAELLREARPELRLLFVSGYGYEITRDHPLMESSSYLSKPFSPEELARKVRETLDA